jgi:hypothetical protein
MFATSWPALDGSLRIPGLVSHPAAPLLGESALAYFLTLQPAEGVPVVVGGRVTPLVWGALLFYFGMFGLGLRLAYRVLGRSRPAHKPGAAVAPRGLAHGV